MKLITRDTDYAVRALLYMAKQPERIISVMELSKATKIPGPFLRKILQILQKRKVLKSYKGKGGGFQLAMEPFRISISGLVKIFQGKMQFHECTLSKKECPEMLGCSLRAKIGVIEKRLISELDSITLDTLIR
jgi:Rrf2 family protein